MSKHKASTTKECGCQVMGTSIVDAVDNVSGSPDGDDSPVVHYRLPRGADTGLGHSSRQRLIRSRASHIEDAQTGQALTDKTQRLERSQYGRAIGSAAARQVNGYQGNVQRMAEKKASTRRGLDAIDWPTEAARDHISELLGLRQNS